MTSWALQVIRLAWSIVPFFIWLNCDLQLFTELMRSMLWCPAEMFLSKTLKLFSAHAVLLLILPSDLRRGAYKNKFSLQGAIYSFSQSAFHWNNSTGSICQDVMLKVPLRQWKAICLINIWINLKANQTKNTDHCVILTEFKLFYLVSKPLWEFIYVCIHMTSLLALSLCIKNSQKTSLCIVTGGQNRYNKQILPIHLHAQLQAGHLIS